MSDEKKPPQNKGVSLFSNLNSPASSKPKQSVSLFGQYTPPKETQTEKPKEKPKKKTDGFGVIGSIADLAQYGFTIQLEEGEDGNLIVEMLNAILPFITADLLGLIVENDLNLTELLDRIQELLRQKHHGLTEHDLELIIEEEREKKEKTKSKKQRFKLFGNQREVGLAFEDDLDDDKARQAAQQLAREIQKLFDKQKSHQHSPTDRSSVFGLQSNNPTGTSTERLNFQLRNANGPMMTVLLTYIIQFAAPSIVNTIARGNPNLFNLLTQFDNAGASKTIHLPGKTGYSDLNATVSAKGKEVIISLQGDSTAVKKLSTSLKAMLPKTPSSDNTGPSSDFSGR